MMADPTFMFTPAIVIGGMSVNGLFANFVTTAGIAELVADGDTVVMKGFDSQGFADGNAIVSRSEHVSTDETRVYIVRAT